MDLRISDAYTPALACDSDNRMWVVWRDFQAKGGRTTLLARHGNGRTWSDDIEIASSGGDLIQPAVAADPEGGVRAFWTEGRSGAWDIYSRQVTPSGPGPEANITRHAAPDFAPAAATDVGGRVWLAWQSRRSGSFGIWVCHSLGGGWSAPVCVSEGGSNCWRPAVAADRDGGVWVGWDSFCNRAYDIYLRHVGPGPSPLAGAERITTTRKYDMEASLAVDAENGVWVVWRRSDPWGREDYYLYPDGQLCLNRYDEKTKMLGRPALKYHTYRGRRCDPGVVPIPVDALRRELPSLPTLLMDGDGALHLFFRRFRDFGTEVGYAWSVEHLTYGGDRWSEIETLSPEMGYSSERPAAALDCEGGVWVGFQGCEFPNLWQRRGGESDSSVYVRRVEPSEGLRQKAVPDDASRGTPRVPVPPISLEDLGFCRKKKGRPSRDGYVLAWGDLHRHTTYSPCKPDRDGSLEDCYRWAYDAGEHDFFVTTDHVDCLNRYTWSESKTYADLFNSEGDLVTLFGFESTYQDRRQMNHYFIDRGISEVAYRAGLLESLDASLELYSKEGIADKVFVARHYHGSMREIEIQDWHPEYEPVFEVVQARGFCFGVMESMLSQGVRMGVEGGCDHSSPPGGGMPWKYAGAITGLWVTELTRKGVFAALKRRRSYATNGKKIELFLSADGHPMGEEYTASDAPTLYIRAEATTEIERVELIRDGQVVFSETGCGRQAELTYTDRGVSPGEHYYYVRLVQEEEPTDYYKGIAVTSPVWVKKA